MKGDFSRVTFDPRKHYSRVLMQQGRVQLDADWNEQQSIHQHRFETQTQDVIGPCGGPAGDAGFEIKVGQDGKTLSIGKGRYYVDGILCENESDLAYDKQPDLPNPSDVPTLVSGAGATVGLVYLDVWQRHITALDDPRIREVALDGPDTTTRAKTVWQVKVLPVKPKDPNVVRGDDLFAEWDDLIQGSTGALSARAQPTAGMDNPCLLPPGSGYRRLENQLYRVEIHKPGPLGTATFKWSRDNGACVTTIEKLSGQEVTVHDVGPDDFLGFGDGQSVEVLSDVQELNGQPSQLLQIDTVDNSTRVITLKSAPTPLDLSQHPKLRRWDSAGEIPVVVPATNDGWIALEDGVEVKFEAGSYETGDYWLIPARTATGSIEWPFTRPQPPLGIRHHYCRVALLQLNPVASSLSVQADCRALFLPLAEVLPALHVLGINWVNDDLLTAEHLTGDGLQVVLDGAPAPQSVDAATVSVTLELPVLGSTDATGARPLVSAILNGDTLHGVTLSGGGIVSATSNIIQWKPGPDVNQLLALLAGLSPRVRVRLKGRAIWSDQGTQRIYLDGQAFGHPGLRSGEGTRLLGDSARSDLLFPSGDGARASDFESWFYLAPQIPPPSLLAFSVSSAAVLAGGTVTGTVTLSSPAPAGGAVVNLVSKDPTVVTLPASATVAAGQTTANVTVRTNAAAMTAGKSVILEASLVGGATTLQAILNVQVVSVTISPAQVTLFVSGQQQFAATVTGTDNTAVTWSVQGGGSITPAGLYVAPGAAGSSQVVVTSVADPSKHATATVTVNIKVKEIRDKSKEIRVDKLVVKEAKEITSDKIAEKRIEKRDVAHFAPISAAALGSSRPSGDSPARGAHSADEVPGPLGQAFIRPEERPRVGAGLSQQGG